MNLDFDVCSVIILGDVNAGKSQLLAQFTSDKPFQIQYSSTISVNFAVKTLRWVDDKNYTRNVKFKLCDTAGSERYRAIVRSYYMSANIVVIAVSSAQTYEEKKRQIYFWRQEVESVYAQKVQGDRDTKKPVFLIVETKSDLISCTENTEKLYPFNLLSSDELQQIIKQDEYYCTISAKQKNMLDVFGELLLTAYLKNKFPHLQKFTLLKSIQNSDSELKKVQGWKEITQERKMTEWLTWIPFVPKTVIHTVKQRIKEDETKNNIKQISNEGLKQILLGLRIKLIQGVYGRNWLTDKNQPYHIEDFGLIPGGKDYTYTINIKKTVAKHIKDDLSGGKILTVTEEITPQSRTIRVPYHVWLMLTQIDLLLNKAVIECQDLINVYDEIIKAALSTSFLNNTRAVSTANFYEAILPIHFEQAVSEHFVPIPTEEIELIQGNYQVRQ